MAVSLLTNTSVTPTLAINAQTASYTFVLADGNNTLVTLANASANTATIPPNSSVAYPVGTVLNSSSNPSAIKLLPCNARYRKMSN